MGRLHKFFQIPAKDRRFLIKVASLVALIRAGLWLFSFNTVRGWVEKLGRPILPVEEAAAPRVINRIVTAVKITSTYIPQATCLTQALATQVLVSRRGLPTILRIGVAKSTAGVFEAHAWVEYQDQIIIGGEDSPTRFTAFPSLESTLQ